MNGVYSPVKMSTKMVTEELMVVAILPFENKWKSKPAMGNSGVPIQHQSEDVPCEQDRRGCRGCFPTRPCGMSRPAIPSSGRKDNDGKFLVHRFNISLRMFPEDKTEQDAPRTPPHLFLKAK